MEMTQWVIESSMTQLESLWLIFLFWEGVTWKISNYAIAIFGNCENTTLVRTRPKCRNPPNSWKNRQIGVKPLNLSEKPPKFRKNTIKEPTRQRVGTTTAILRKVPCQLPKNGAGGCQLKNQLLCYLETRFLILWLSLKGWNVGWKCEILQCLKAWARISGTKLKLNFLKTLNAALRLKGISVLF